MLGFALVVGATAGVLQIVEARAQAGSGWRLQTWVALQTWVLALVGSGAALPQFFYAAAAVSGGPSAGWTAAGAVVESYAGGGVLVLAALSVSWVPVALGRARRLPLLSQIGLACMVAPPCAALLGAGACLLHGPELVDQPLLEAFRSLMAAAFLLVLVFLAGLLSVAVPLSYRAADRLVEVLTTRSLAS